MSKENIHKFEAKLESKQGVYVLSKIRSHSLDIDEPKELGGSDRGPNPVELVLAALGGCQEIVLRVYGQKLGVEIESIETTVQGKLDIEGFLGLSNVRPGFQEVRAITKVKAKGSPDKIKELLRVAEERCPVLDIVRNNVPVKVEIKAQ